MFVCISIYIYLSSIYVSVGLSMYLSIYQSSVCLSIYLSLCLSFNHLSNQSSHLSNIYLYLSIFICIYLTSIYIFLSSIYVSVGLSSIHHLSYVVVFDDDSDFTSQGPLTTSAGLFGFRTGEGVLLAPGRGRPGTPPLAPQCPGRARRRVVSSDVSQCCRG